MVSQAYPVSTPISLSQGGAGVAAHNVSEGILFNPALVAQGSSMEYSFFHTSLHDKKSLSGISFGKNEPHLLASLGLSYLRGEKESLFQIVLGKSNKQVSWGVALYRVKASEEKYLDWNMRVGLAAKLSSYLQWGVVYSHFLKSPGKDRDFPKEISFGMERIMSSKVSFRLDGVWQLEKNPENQIIWRTGGQWALLGPIVIRSGLERNPLEGLNYYTAGMGVRLGKWALDYGWRRTRKSRDQVSIVHSLDFRTFSW